MSAILKTYIHQSGSSGSLQHYLAFGRQNTFRALACDFSPLIIQPQKWAKEFDADRKDFNKNEGRKTYHFVLSPAASENATLEEVQSFAKEWVMQNLPDTKWAIYYHNDNGIIHAHIAVNAVKTDGYKLQFTDEDWADLANSAHRIAESHGFDNERLDDVLTPKQKAQQRRNKELLQAQIKRSYTTKRMEERGKPTLKGRIRDAINTAKVQAHNWKEFELLMRKQGIDPRPNKQGGYTYYLLDPVKIKGREVYDFAIKDKKLDEDNELKYTRAEIEKSFNFNFVDALNAPHISAEEIKKITLEYQMKRHFRIVRSPLDKEKMPNSFHVVNMKTYHGRLSRNTINQSLENVDAISRAMEIVRKENITDKQDLLKANAESLEKREELVALLNDELERLEPIEVLVSQFKALHAARLLDNKSREKEVLAWLNERGYSPVHSPWAKGQRMECEANIAALQEQIQLIDTTISEREDAYNTINESLKLPNKGARSATALGNKAPSGSYKTAYKPPARTMRKMSFAQTANAEKTKRATADYYELELRKRIAARTAKKEVVQQQMQQQAEVQLQQQQQMQETTYQEVQTRNPRRGR